MNLKTLVDAIGGISGRHIDRADRLRPRRWYIPVAAVLAAAIALGGVLMWRGGDDAPGPDAGTPGSAQLLAEAKYPERVSYTERTYDEWIEQRRELSLTQEERDALTPYLRRAIPVFLSGMEGENTVCSPAGMYIGLAMFSETTAGSSQKQLLELLGSRDMAELRALAGRVWNALYVDDGVSELELASSLWLNDSMTYDAGTLGRLADIYYASAYSGAMGSEDYDRMFRDWLNAHTGNMLNGELENAGFAEGTAMELVSTVYFRDRWYFDKNLTEQGTFHAPRGDENVMYMHRTIQRGRYYWGDSFGAIYSDMENSTMALILPDEGVTPEELLSDPQALSFICGSPDRDKSGSYDIDLTLPRFDVVRDLECSDMLRTLGVTEVFDPWAADLAPLGVMSGDADIRTFLSGVRHGTRVKVDEDGCEGAVYTAFDIAPSDMPPKDQEKLVLTFDRPFIFAVLQQNLPVFVGIVNHPGIDPSTKA